MYDERMAYLDQQQAEMRQATRDMAYPRGQFGVLDLALLPVTTVIGVLCGTLQLIAEQRAENERIQAEAQTLEARIMAATQRAKEGQIVPMEYVMGVTGRG